VLREYLDDFYSTYVDDILIFTDGSREDYEKRVNLVLGKLEKVGLFLDIDKCEFLVTCTKYLGFVLDVKSGVEMDPEKIKAILD
jgi:hypothetical protein